MTIADRIRRLQTAHGSVSTLELYEIADKVAALEAREQARLSALAAGPRHFGNPGKAARFQHDVYEPMVAGPEADEWVGVGMSDKAIRSGE
jgi:hypothetical protein